MKFSKCLNCTFPNNQSNARVYAIHLSAIIRIAAKREELRTGKFALRLILSICWWVLKMVHVGLQGLAATKYIHHLEVREHATFE